MQLQISPRDGIPIYLQIVNQVKYLVAAERLAPGEALPSVRKLAEQLVINPNTVSRAYRELESSGVLTTRRGAGVYVSDGGSPLARREHIKILTERMDVLLAEARQMDVDLETLVGLLHKRNRLLEPAASRENRNG